MQHQGRDDAARDTRDEVLVLEVAQDVKLTRGARRAAALDRRHAVRYAVVAVLPPLLHARYRSVIGDARSRILASANNARLHSAAYLLVRGRHCRRAVVASHVAEIYAPRAFSFPFCSLGPLARPRNYSWLPPIMQHRPADTPTRTPSTAILPDHARSGSEQALGKAARWRKPSTAHVRRNAETGFTTERVDFRGIFNAWTPKTETGVV